MAKRAKVPPEHRPLSHGALYHPSSTQYSWREHKGRYVKFSPWELSFGKMLSRMSGPIDWSQGKLR